MSETARTGGAYRTLDEQREVLSPAEERFERARQTLGLFMGPVAFLVMYFAPLPLEPAQQPLAAILTFTVVYWLFEAVPIPVTAILALATCVVFGVASSDDVYISFASDTIFVFIGAFIIAQAMTTHRLDRRFAFRVLSLPGVARFAYGVIVALGAIAAAAGLDPIIPALAAVSGALFGFMMLVSTPLNAVVYGSGMIPITEMVRSGIVFDITGILLIVALIPVMARLTGLA